MKQFERREAILTLLRETSGVVYIDDLVAQTGASPSTVRRDLRTLETAGELTALRGGAVRLNERMSELPVAAKELINIHEKRAIATAAADLVEDRDTIYVDSGTTTLQVLPLLRNVRVHVVTSNTHVLALRLDPRIQVTMLPGDYLADTGSVAGALTDRVLEDMFFDKAFIGANGCSRRAGVTTFDLREANKKRLAQEHSGETYVLVDHTKLGATALCRAFDLSQCTVICDQDDELLAAAKGRVIAGKAAEEDSQASRRRREEARVAPGDAGTG
ncbi:DeoR/GlpR transcriptional regulator [Actinomyces sp. 2119]|uniref:DeoR/GlpR transcriptional regulator n=1 Tax=Actinomyces lilanjuaniae TaxID=2321394 RepID=A0ABM6Z2D2_9ACTO|nr:MULTISPECIES: DeoR/GlpR family DNA-binding transcription regulator [Actinomyces]AYD89473.1 DeoR/GlpR transcriptional regulator [Actinomyces lilanjuaniae]RJF43168.1 DeoR/GlpR transcriptional regulator [Actinomyces sp. 2119]